MGTGNADCGGGLDRPSPAKVIADLDKFAQWEPPESPRAVAMREAAAALRALAPRQPIKNPLDDPEFQACGYKTELSKDDDKLLRLTFYGATGNRRPLGFMILRSPEVYDMSTHLLRKYDELEGIE